MTASIDMGVIYIVKFIIFYPKHLQRHFNIKRSNIDRGEVNTISSTFNSNPVK